MKKISYFASLMLTVFMTTSCLDSTDNPIPTPVKTTTTITLDGTNYEADVVATFKGEVGQEVSLTLGVYDEFDIYGVDFGDGNIVTDTVCYQNGGLRDAEGITRKDTKHTAATVFPGVVAGEGIITVYSVNKSDIWYLIVEGNAIPTSFDQEKLKNVVQAKFSGANVESVELPAMEYLTQFDFNNSPVKTLDVSKATALTSLSVDNTTQSQYAPQLESIDLSKNTELTYLKIVGNATNKGKLAAIDLSKNTKLTNVYLQDNAIKTAVMPEGAALSFLNLQNNELETIDLSVCASNKDVYLDNNKLKSATLGAITKSCKLENNAFTLATLPAQPAGLSTASKTKKFTYAPQAALVVDEIVAELDLSSQLTVAQGELNPADYATYLTATTAYSFVTATGTTLVEGTDYEVTEPGKFRFIKAQAEKVHVVMSNEAFPKFKDTNAFVTTEFTAAKSALLWIVPQDYFESGISANTTLFDNDFASGQTVFNATAKAAAATIAGKNFVGYLQVRVKADPTAENPTGTENEGSTPIVITAKQDVTINVYNRRQKGSDGYYAGDNKALLCWDQAAKATLAGTETFDQYEKNSDGQNLAAYGYVVTTFNLSAGKTYTLYRKNSTMRIFGISFE